MTVDDALSNASMLSLPPSAQPCTSTKLQATNFKDNKQTFAERIKKNIDKKCNGDKTNMFFRKKSIKLCSKFVSGGSGSSSSGNSGNANKNDAEKKSKSSIAVKCNTTTSTAPQTTEDEPTNPNGVSNVDMEKTVGTTVETNKSSPNKSNNNNRNSGTLKLSYNNLIASLLRTTTL